MENEQKPKKKIWKRWWFWVLVVIILIMIIGTGGSKNNTPVNVKNNSEPTRESYVFDTPALVGKNLDELKMILGNPDNNSEPPLSYIQNSDVRTWEKVWNKNGYSLSATYNIDTKKIEELFLSANTDASLSEFRNKENILRVGNLSENSNDYSLEFVKVKAILGQANSQTPNGYTGVAIKAK